MTTADPPEPAASSTVRRRAQQAFWPLVVVCALLGLSARLWNLDFDQRQHLHPDERFWALTSDAMNRTPHPAAHGTFAGPVLDWLDGQRSPANPYSAEQSFVYGPLPLAMARGVAGWLHDGVESGAQPALAVTRALDQIGIPLIDDQGAARFDDGYGVDLIGRVLSALFDTATIVVVALIGRRLGGKLAGVVGAAFYACSVLAIQHAHFLGSEPLLGLASATTVLLALRLDRSASLRRAAIDGGLLGLAGGLAVAVKLTGTSLMGVVVVGCGALLWRHRRRSDLVRLVSVLLGAAVAFRICDPSAFNGLGFGLSKPFLDDVKLARSFTSSTSPPAFQWANRTPIVQPLVWLSVFTIGPGVALASVAGSFALSARLLSRRMPRLGALARCAPEVARWPAAFVLAAVAVPFLYVSIFSFPTGRYYIPMLPALTAVAAVGTTFCVRVALQHRARLRVRWPAGLLAGLSLTLAAVWGVGFVVGVYGHTNTRIEASWWIDRHVPTGSVLTVEAWDDGLPLRLPGLDVDRFRGEQLNLVDPDSPAKLSNLAAEIGRVDYVIESSPRIWGTVTRMPNRFPSTIAFFEGLDSGGLGFERVATFRSGISLGPWRLDDRHADESFSVVDHPEVRIWRKVRTVDRDTIVALLDPIAAANAVAIDPTRASSGGLLLTPSELATNASGPTYDDAFDTNGSNVVHLVAWFVLLELIGLAAFALFLPLLAGLPDAGWGAAKILGLGTIAVGMFVATAWLRIDLGRTTATAITAALVATGAAVGWRRRARLRDVWRERRTLLLACEAISVALFVVFVVVRAIDPDLWHFDRGGEKPFELALLTAVLRTKTLPVYDPWYSHGALNYYYGGWFLLSGPARVLRTSPSTVMNLAMGVVAMVTAGAAFTAGAGVAAARPRWRGRSRTARTSLVAGCLAPVFVLLASNGAIVRPLWRWATGDLPRDQVDWWGLSRVIPNSVAITEFPAWSFLFGDVHPHVMGIAVLLGSAALCLAWHQSLVAERRGAAVTLAVMLAAGAGLVRMTNTWDYPLTVALVTATVVLALVARVPWRRLILPAAAFLVVLLVLWHPYVQRSEVFDAGFDPAALRTPPSSWLKQFGWFGGVSVCVFAFELGSAFPRSRPVWQWITRAHLVVVACSLAALTYLAVRPGFETFEITASLTLGCAWIAWHRRRRAVRGMLLGPLVLATGWAIQAVVEMVTVRNDGGRQNTVFKFWYESWIVLAIGSAVVVAELLWARAPSTRRAGRLAVVSALVMASAFWALTLPVRLDDRLSDGGLSLDGEAYLTPDFVYGSSTDRFVPSDDMPLIDWLRSNVHGIHVVAEAPGIDYKWTGRVSWLTGLPTPLGWAYHESQQRRIYGASLEARKQAMNQLFTTTDPGTMATIMSNYSIEYVVFGTQERLLASLHSEAALRGFECLHVDATADRSTETGSVPDELFVATVDTSCVSRLRPPLPQLLPTSGR
jgi:YYY domain-containing protein